MSVLWGNIAFPKLAALWLQGNACDVKINCRNGAVKAPSILLSAVSDRLHEVLQLSTDKILTFKDTSVETWNCILQILYLGSIVFPNVDLSGDLMTLCSALSFAYCLNIQDVLNLYQHAAHMDTRRQMTALWEDFSLEAGLEVALEYSRTVSGNVTRYQTVFTADNCIKLKDVIRKCHDVINLDSRDIEIPKDRASKVERICIKCGVGGCDAQQVQCVYCSENIDVENGAAHVEERHLFSPSVILPITCNIDVNKDKKCVKGRRFLRNTFCEESELLVQTVIYKCLLCDHVVHDIPSYINHFLTHGFFAQVCEHCGDAFSSAAVSEKHAMFCGIKDMSTIHELVDLMEVSESSEKVQQNTTSEITEVSTENEDNEESCILHEIKREDFLARETQSHRLPKLLELGQGVQTDIKGKCNECGFKCKGTSVQCLLCYRTVNNKVNHMFQHHTNCGKAKIWPYTCEPKRDSKEMVVKLLDNYSFECLLCDKLFPDKDTVISHVQEHRIHSVFFCKHCQSGFKSAINRNSHQHFCGGGDCTQCKHCKLFFSTFDQLDKHQKKKHKDVLSPKIVTDENVGVIHKEVTPRKKQNFVFGRIKTEPEEIIDTVDELPFNGPRQCKCMNCGAHCLSQRVKCAYCYLVVDNNEKHMEEMHPFTPKRSAWVYNCRFMAKTAEAPTGWLVCAKMKAEGKSHGGKSYYYKCLQCKTHFPSKTDVLRHMKQKHQMSVSTCKVCEAGFRCCRYLKDHEHFCKGGSPVKCSLCSAVPGTHKILADHYRKYHYKTSQQMGEKEGEDCDLYQVTEDMDDIEDADYSGGDERSDQEENESDDAGESNDFLMKVKAGQLPDREMDRSMFCTSCQGPCEASQVKCLYCFQIVDNSPSHMTKVHAFTPANCIWVVNCRFVNSKAYLGQRWMIFMKEYNPKNSSERRHVTYRCMKCRQTKFSSLELVRKHVHQKHGLKIKICRVCHMGFKDGRYHKDHELFCCGGEPLSCHLCDKIVGNYKGRSDHIHRCHPVAKSELKKRDMNEEDLSDGANDSSSASENEAFAAELGNTPDSMKGRNDEEESMSTRTKGHKKTCIYCASRCNALKVKCLYCFQVVDNKPDHMATFHAFTPRSSTWVFSCRFKHSQALSSERWMIFRKEHGGQKAGESKVVFRCMRCKKQFTSLDIVIKHVKKIHNLNSKVCVACEVGFMDPRYLKDHELFCHGGLPLNCDFCGKVVGNHKHMRDHLRMHHPLGDVPQDEIMPTEAKMKEPRHQSIKKKMAPVDEGNSIDLVDVSDEVKDNEVTEEHITKNCDETVTRRNICGSCGEDKCVADVVKCLYCHKVVENSAVHMRNMHPFTPKTNAWIYTCRFQAKISAGRKDLMVFIKKPRKKRNADGNKQDGILFKCIQCRVLCATKKTMMQHMTTKHRISSSVCSVCDSGFSTLSILREHRHFCQGGEVMKCDLCGKLVGGLKAMSDHMSVIHRGMGQSWTRKRKIFPRYTRPGKRKRIKLEQDSDVCENNEILEEEEVPEEFEVTDDLMQKYFEPVEVHRTKTHTKVCVNCLEDCAGEAVKCFYCEDIIASEKISTHMQENHPWTPDKSLFPVSCKFVKHQFNIPDIVARPVSENIDAMGEIVKDPVNTCKYRCELCKKDCENSKFVEKHIEDVHSIKPCFCKICGLCMKKGIQSEHQHFCGGGDMWKCKECNKVVGGKPNASIHRSRIHPFNPKNKAKYASYNPRTFDRRDLASMSSVGNHGYTIVSADCGCGGPKCTQRMVKCSLCNTIVEKDDRHMKLKHPYSPANTWVVYCKYSFVSRQKMSRETVGEKIPDASEEEILHNPCIPTDLNHWYRCCRCDMKFDNHYRLKCHLKGVHLHTERLYTCKHCESFFCNMTSDTFANHVHLCRTGSLFTCDVCDLLCSTAKGLYYHMTAAHPDEKKAKQMEYKEDRDENMVVPEGTEVQCTLCDFTTTVVPLVREHVKVQHGFKCSRLNQVCKFCYKMFQTRSMRERHEQDEHLVKKKHLCEICGKEFDIPYQLKSHMYYFHRGGREVACLRKRTCTKSEESAICPHCGNLYGSLLACKQHIKNVHQKNETWKCSYCSRTFACKMTLKVHEDRHLGNKTCRCPYCPYVAYTGYAVNKHAEKQHPGAEKPFGMRTIVLPADEKANKETIATSALGMPMSIMNNLDSVPAEPLTLEAVDKIEFDGNDNGFDDVNSKSVVQYFVVKNEQN